MTQNYNIEDYPDDWNVVSVPDDTHYITTCTPYLPGNCIVFDDAAGATDSASLSWSYTMETVMIGEPYIFEFSAYLTEPESGQLVCTFDTAVDQTYTLPFNNPAEFIWTPVTAPFTPSASETTISCTITFTSVAQLSLSNFEYSAVCYEAGNLRRMRARQLLMRGGT